MAAPAATLFVGVPFTRSVAAVNALMSRREIAILSPPVPVVKLFITSILASTKEKAPPKRGNLVADD